MSKRQFGRVDKVTEAGQVKTLLRGGNSGQAGQSHNALTLHAEVADIFDITSSQVLNADASLTRGDIIIADSNPNWTTLAHSGSLMHLTTNANDVTWQSNLFLESTNWVGLGVAKGRLGFIDAASDVAVFQNCNVGINTTGPDRVLESLHTTAPQLRLTHTDNSVYADFQVTSGGNLTVTPTGDFIFDPVGNDILPQTPYDLNIGSEPKKYLTLHAAELWVQTLVAQNTIATIGGRVIVAPTTVLSASAGSAATSITVKHNQMANGDRIIMEASGHFEAMSVDDNGTGVPGAYAYSVTRNLDGTGANDWYAGDAVVNTGATGDGFIDLYSINGVTASATTTGPTIVGNVRKSATYNDWGEHWAIGNLDGLYGYGTTTYGAAFGEYSGSAWITLDPTNGIQFWGADGTKRAQLAGSLFRMGDPDNEHFSVSASVLSFRDGGTTYAQMTASALTMGIISGGEYVAIEASGISLFGGASPNIVLDSSGNATFGRAGSDAGNMYWNNSNKQLQFRGGSAGTDVQAYVDVDGTITGGDGTVTLNASGLQIVTTTDYEDPRSINFVNSGSIHFAIQSKVPVAGQSTTLLYQENIGKPNLLQLRVPGPSATENQITFWPSTTGQTAPTITCYAGSVQNLNAFRVNNANISIYDWVTPASPVGGEVHIYVNNENLIFQYTDSGTVRYKYLDLTGTGTTWVHSTTAP